MDTFGEIENEKVENEKWKRDHNKCSNENWQGKGVNI